MPVTYEPITTTTLSTAASSITFSSITGSYTDLRLVVTCGTTNGNDVRLEFNNDGSAIYHWGGMEYNGTVNPIFNGNMSYLPCMGGVAAPTTPTAQIQVDINSYSATTRNKTALITNAMDRAASGGVVTRVVGLYASTSAITTVKIYVPGSTLVAGTVATLYGITRV